MARALARLDALTAWSESGAGVFHHPVRDLLARYGEDYRHEAEFILARLEEFAACWGETLEDAFTVHLEHLERLLRERREFRAGERPYGGEPAAVAALMRDELFKRRYLYVLTLSTVLDRSRYETSLCYRRAVRDSVAGAEPVLEIGAGNCLEAAYTSAYAPVEAYELNDLSLLWRDILRLGDRVRLTIGSYGFDEPERFQLAALIELLEHVPDPAAYVRGVHRVLRGSGRAYLTFAIRMPQVDHLYCFRSIDECREIVAAGGLRIVSENCQLDTFRPFAEEERWRLAETDEYPVTYGCLLRKREPGEADLLVAAFNDGLETEAPWTSA